MVGTCDCGDPNFENIISCEEHNDFSEIARNNAYNLISEKNRE